MVNTIRKLSTAQLFAAQLDQFEVPEADTLNAALLRDIAAWRAAEPGVKANNVGGWHSTPTLFERTEPTFRSLCRAINGALFGTIRVYWPEFEPRKHRFVEEGWVNVSGRGQMNAAHSHATSHISGVYYVKVPSGDEGAERDGEIEFHNPAGAILPLLSFGKKMTKTAFRIKPREGLMLVFPGYLRHLVYPSHSDEDRISIAFNIRVEPEVRPRGKTA